MVTASIILSIVALAAAAVNKLTDYDFSEKITLQRYAVNRSSNDILFTALILNIIVSLISLLQ